MAPSNNRDRERDNSKDSSKRKKRQLSPAEKILQSYEMKETATTSTVELAESTEVNAEYFGRLEKNRDVIAHLQEFEKTQDTQNEANHVNERGRQLKAEEGYSGETQYAVKFDHKVRAQRLSVAARIVSKEFKEYCDKVILGSYTPLYWKNRDTESNAYFEQTEKFKDEAKDLQKSFYHCVKDMANPSITQNEARKISKLFGSDLYESEVYKDFSLNYTSSVYNFEVLLDSFAPQSANEVLFSGSEYETFNLFRVELKNRRNKPYTTPIAEAVWDGSKNDLCCQKSSVTIINTHGTKETMHLGKFLNLSTGLNLWSKKKSKKKK